MLLLHADHNHFSVMMSTLNNICVSTHKDVYPKDRLGTFTLLKNWKTTNDYNSGKGRIGLTTGSSFNQNGENKKIVCSRWGKEGIECTKLERIKKHEVRQAKHYPNEGQQHFNVKESMGTTTHELVEEYIMADKDPEEPFDMAEY
jgi:hypothetical protein